MKKRKDIVSSLANTIIERPIPFDIDGERFCLYPPTLGKVYLLSGTLESAGIMRPVFKDSYTETLRICSVNREQVGRILSISTFRDKYDLLDEHKVGERTRFFTDKLLTEELAKLFSMAMSFDNAEEFEKHYGLDREQVLRQRIMREKGKDGSISFGGLTPWGGMIDFACKRYGWTLDYVLWGISFTNLQMLMADAITSVYLTKEERKRMNIPDDTTFINADDPKNIDRIKSMNWD